MTMSDEIMEDVLVENKDSWQSNIDSMEKKVEKAEEDKKKDLCKSIVEFIILIVLAGSAFVIKWIPGHNQAIIMIETTDDGDLKNPVINHPFVAETFSDALFVVCAIVLCTLLLLERHSDRGEQQETGDRGEKQETGVGTLLREVLWSFSIATFVTAIGKMYVGQPRPNFFEYCEWEDGEGCTVEKLDAYRSFPSGHATSATSIFGLLCIHWVDNVILQLRGNTRRIKYGWCRRFFKTIHDKAGHSAILVALIPGFFALFISASRVHDNYHFASDIVAGAVIGFSSALLSFQMFKQTVSSGELRTSGDFDEQG